MASAGVSTGTGDGDPQSPLVSGGTSFRDLARRAGQGRAEVAHPTESGWGWQQPVPAPARAALVPDSVRGGGSGENP